MIARFVSTAGELYTAPAVPIFHGGEHVADRELPVAPATELRDAATGEVLRAATFEEVELAGEFGWTSLHERGEDGRESAPFECELEGRECVVICWDRGEP